MQAQFNRLSFLFFLSLAWLLIEGIFRKWIFYEFASVLFYIKYILFGLTYVAFFITYGVPRVKRTYQVMILIYGFVCVLSTLNPRLDNPAIIGIIGLIVHLFFIPVSHLTQYYLNSLKGVYSFIRILAYASIPICILGVVQFYMPADSPINAYVNEEQLINKVKEFTRISSIFPFMKLYNIYLLFSTNLLLGVMLIRLLNNESIKLYAFSLILLFINMVMTGSRFALVLMLIYFILIFIYSIINLPPLRKIASTLSVFSIVVVIALYFTTDVVKDPVDAVIWRYEKAESRHKTESTGYTDVLLRTEDRLAIFKYGNEAGMLGYGIGLAYQGSSGLLKNRIPFYYEEEGERFVLELGILGGIVILLVRLSILFFSLFVLYRSRNVEFKLLLLPLVLLLTPPTLALQNTLYNYLDNFTYWFAFGLIISLHKIEKTLKNNEA